MTAILRSKAIGPVHARIGILTTSAAKVKVKQQRLNKDIYFNTCYPAQDRKFLPSHTGKAALVVNIPVLAYEPGQSLYSLK